MGSIVNHILSVLVITGPLSGLSSSCSACLSFAISTYLKSCSFLCHLGWTIQYEEKLYRVAEKADYITLALVLDKVAPFPVTVSVNTLDLLDSSVGDSATGELEHTGLDCAVQISVRVRLKARVRILVGCV